MHWFENNLSSLIPSFFGSVVALTRSQDSLTPTQAAIRIIVGTVTSFYITPVIADVFEVSSRPQHWLSALAFLIGMTGYALVPTLTKLVMIVANNYLRDNDEKR